MREVRRLRGIMAGGRDNDDIIFTQEDFCECIGVEKYLKPELLRVSLHRKQAHINAILISQNRCNDEEVLSQVSQVSSRWARARASQLALMSGHLLQE